jgi:hypothetical protein
MPSRRQLTSGVASSRNNGHDTSEDDLVICEGDLLVSTDKRRRYVLFADVFLMNTVWGAVRCKL